MPCVAMPPESNVYLVGGRARSRVGADRASGAGAVFHDHRLAEGFLQARRGNARDERRPRHRAGTGR